MFRFGILFVSNFDLQRVVVGLTKVEELNHGLGKDCYFVCVAKELTI
ncbi:hypothetical protein AALP_AA7G053900 [Arabis alpina]|uniref:Uncharacterized protein n=1 Tax=Arabis alpina TaxID=50452 RepID=A0A087GG22_ARAAL|nr:hypothetical protein AALP_AA7G053900 [Arabis alpina]